MEYDLITIKNAHKHCSLHKYEILKSQKCGCFYCLAVFYSNEILDWVDDDGINDYPKLATATALCPKCGIDAVIGDLSGYPVNDKIFLQAMYNYWF